jgi:hypothetical protein
MIQFLLSNAFNLNWHLRFVGALLVFLGLAHAAFPRRFGWKNELQNVSLLTRQIFYVHHFFVAFVVTLQGVLCLFWAQELLAPSPLARLLLAGLVIFWATRWLFQFFVYDKRLWQGDTFNTRMHLLFSLLWTYLVVVFAWALCLQWLMPPR